MPDCNCQGRFLTYPRPDPRALGIFDSVRGSAMPAKETRSVSAQKWGSGAGLDRSILYIGAAVFLFGLKNGSGTTVAVVFRRWASMVSSIWSLVPGFEYSVLILARATSFFSSGENA